MCVCERRVTGAKVERNEQPTLHNEFISTSSGAPFTLVAPSPVVELGRFTIRKEIQTPQKSTIGAKHWGLWRAGGERRNDTRQSQDPRHVTWSRLELARVCDTNRPDSAVSAGRG
jgi:hypothetical protein